MKWIIDIMGAFMQGLLENPAPHKECVHKEKEMHKQMTEKQIDKMVEGTFPASDPPSTY